MSTLQGDGPCDECGTTDNIVWFTDDTLWNGAVRADHWADRAYGGEPILCIRCFVKICEERGFRPTGWRLLPQWPVRRAPQFHRCRLCGWISISPSDEERHKSWCPGTSVVRYVCPACFRAAPWADGMSKKSGDDRDEFWCPTCGTESPLQDCEKVEGRR